MSAPGKKEHLDYLKAFAIAFVVLDHTFSLHGVGGLGDGWGLFYALVCSVHVPLFFVIAGYLCHRQDYGRYLKKKCLRVLVPFVTFTVLKLVYTLFVSDDFAHADSLGMQLYDAFICGNLYWFAYSIFAMYAIAPLFWEHESAGGNVGRRMIAALLLCIIVNVIVPYNSLQELKVFQIGRTVLNLCFFVAGMLIRQYEARLGALLRRHRNIALAGSLIVVAALSIAAYYDAAGMLHESILFRVPMAFSLMLPLYLLARRLLCGNRVLRAIGRYSLQIMFFDSFYKAILFAVAGRFLSPNAWLLIALSAVNIALGCISCMVIERIPHVRTAFGL